MIPRRRVMESFSSFKNALKDTPTSPKRMITSGNKIRTKRI